MNFVIIMKAQTCDEDPDMPADLSVILQSEKGGGHVQTHPICLNCGNEYSAATKVGKGKYQVCVKVPKLYADKTTGQWRVVTLANWPAEQYKGGTIEFYLDYFAVSPKCLGDTPWGPE